MKVLVVGVGGREHALAWRLAQNTRTEVFALPGNPGMARVATCLPGDATPPRILAAACSVGADVTVIGPEAPLVAGVADLFRAEDRAIVGPTAAMAQLEGSKIFAKKFFVEHGIPTAQYVATETREEATQALERFALPVVIKADGLASGKGVTIARDRAEAEAAVAQLGPRLVIEEYLEGPEVSFIVLSDGKNVLTMAPSRDHKPVGEGDQGPNTGGMGAYCDSGLLSTSQVEDTMNRVIAPAVEAMSYTGFLYAGLILTRDGPKVLEFNVRMGDPETQAICLRMASDPGEVFLAAARGGLGQAELNWKPGAATCVVLAAAGYPESPRVGDAIDGIEPAEAAGAVVFHAGTRVGWGGLYTAGGRVLGVGATGPDVGAASEKAYMAAGRIHFDGMHYRRDIGRAYHEAKGT